MPSFTSRAALAVALPLALALPQTATAAPQAVVASATAHDFRIVLTATKVSGGAAPAATVHVTAYVHGRFGWTSRGELRLGTRGGYFWKVLEGGHAVRDFTISNDSPARGSVQLLVTPALGWSTTYHFQLEHGRLVR
jgi:hypothetical protein